jgi:flagellar secretion chaperone FliS
MRGGAAARYLTLDIESMSPARRIVFLYSFILGQLKKARQNIASEDPDPRNECLGKAQDAVNELLIALDRDRGGLFADRMASLYAYFLKELLALSVKPSGERLDRLISMVRSLHEAWNEAADAVPYTESAGVHADA